MRELTARQREVLNFVRTFCEREGVPPTVREIGARFRVTPRAAFDHLAALERKGMLERRATAGRSSRSLVPSGRSSFGGTVSIPILGRIAAGQPLLAAENRGGTLPIVAAAPARRGEGMVGLPGRGASMIRAHILDA